MEMLPRRSTFYNSDFPVVLHNYPSVIRTSSYDSISIPHKLFFVNTLTTICPAFYLFFSFPLAIYNSFPLHFSPGICTVYSSFPASLHLCRPRLQMIKKPVHTFSVNCLIGRTDFVCQADQIALPIRRWNGCQRKHMSFDDILFHNREIKDLFCIFQCPGRMGKTM